MKKPLHASMLISENGQVIEWGTKDVKNLLKAANEAVISDVIETGTWKSLSEIFVYEWFEKIAEKGITPELIKKLNAPISHLQYRRALMYSEDGLPYWREVADGNVLNQHPKLKITYMVSHLLAIGALKGLKRCNMKDCKKFFIGPPNRLWCSKKCGSLHRVRKQRKLKNSTDLFNSNL